MEKIQSLEWLAAKQYAALLVLNLVPEQHIPHLSTLALSIKNAISISENLKDLIPSTKGKLINDGEK